MKIISKYKDYYDYLSGVYGEDPKLVLDRRSGVVIDITSESLFNLYIGGYCIHGYYKNGVYYYGEELLQFDSYQYEPNDKRRDYVNLSSFGGPVNLTITKDLDNYNIIKKCPILLTYRGWSYKLSGRFYEYPKLESLELNSFIQPFEVYQMISTWLANRVDENELVTTMSDAQKILNKGFDVKSSFRPNMKEK